MLHDYYYDYGLFLPNYTYWLFFFNWTRNVEDLRVAFLQLFLPKRSLNQDGVCFHQRTYFLLVSLQLLIAQPQENLTIPPFLHSDCCQICVHFFLMDRVKYHGVDPGSTWSTLAGETFFTVSAWKSASPNVLQKKSRPFQEAERGNWVIQSVWPSCSLSLSLSSLHSSSRWDLCCLTRENFNTIKDAGEIAKKTGWVWGGI